MSVTLTQNSYRIILTASGGTTVVLTPKTAARVEVRTPGTQGPAGNLAIAPFITRAISAFQEGLDNG